MRAAPFVAVFAVAAVGCGAADDAKPKPDSAKRSPAATVELTVSRGASADQGFASQLSGLVHGARRVAGIPVVVEADAWPRDGRFVPVRRVRTGRNGRFRLNVTAQNNTTYRARAAGTHSPGTNVEVWPSPTYRLVLADPNTSRALIRYPLPPGAPFARVRVYLYTGGGKAPILRRAGSATLRRTGPHEAGVEIEY